MATRTRLKCKIVLRKDTPEGVLSILKRVLIRGDLGINKVIFESEDVFKPDSTHEFFKCENWYMLFLSTDWEDIGGGKMYQERGYWVIDLETQFRCHDDEIEKFVDWITPFVVGRKKKKYIGYWRVEYTSEETNIYIEREKFLQEEKKKCIASPVYFYNKYYRKAGDPELTEEDFKKEVERRRYISGRSKEYPLTPDDVF